MVKNTHSKDKCPVELMYAEHEHYSDETMSQLQLMSIAIAMLFCVGLVMFSIYTLTR